MGTIPYGRFIDPLTDFGFKRIFGTDANKEILIDFLNALLAGERQVLDLTYSQTEKSGQRPIDRKAIFDLCCTGADGEQFIIEVQRVRQKYFRDRCVYYAASLIRDQVRAGAGNWAFDLKPVYLIGLMEFTFDDSPGDQCVHHVRLTAKGSCEVFYDKFGLTFIEMPAFAKPAHECTSALDKWLFLLKNLSKLDHVPEAVHQPVFEKVLAIAEVCNLNQQEKMAWDAYLKAKWDNENSLAYAKEEGEREGMKKGEEEGLKKGQEQGLKVGFEKGVSEGLLLTARNMKAKGFDIRTIAEVTGLTADEIRLA